MTAREEYTESEWATLALTPFLVGFAVAFSDGGGVVETLRETGAMIAERSRALRRYADNELVTALLKNQTTVEREAGARTRGLPSDPEGAPEGYLKAAEASAREAAALLAERSHPREAGGYKHFVLGIAVAVAEATRSGGWFSRGPLVDDAEKAAIARIAAALGLDEEEAARLTEGDGSHEPPPPDVVPGGSPFDSGPLQPG